MCNFKLRVTIMSFQFWKSKQPITGLTLSGGGMRGIAHIAILKALEEHDLRPAIISGSSAGAVVGAFYAAGLSPDDMIDVVIKRSFFSRSSFRFRTNGIFSTRFLADLLKEFIPEDDFDCLKIPLTVAVTELTQGRTEYVSEGKLFDILIASASIPYIFPPVRLGDKVYLDGGIMNNLPIEPIRNQCDFLVGAHVNSIEYQPFKRLSLLKELDRVIHLAIGQSVYQKAKLCNIFFDPPGMMQYGMLEKKNVGRMFDEVYKYSMALLESLGYVKQ